jgi:hypothetical protein
VPIAAVNPYPKIGGMPPGWEFERAYGLPYSQIDCVDAQTDPTFTPPAPEFKSALRCYTLPHHPALFQPMSTRSDLHVVTFGRTANPGFFGLGTIRLEVGVRYKLRFWVKTTGDIRDLNYLFFGVTDGRGKTKGGGQVFLQKGSVSASSDWTQFSTTFEVKSDDGGKKDPSFSRFSLAYSGDGAVEVDGFDCEEEP